MSDAVPLLHSRDADRRDDGPRRVIVLGSTGSIGVNALACIEHLNALARRTGSRAAFEVVGLAARGSAQLLDEQARRFGVRSVALADGAGAGELAIFRGADAALQLVESVARRGDLVLAAIVGAAGLPATLAAIERGCSIALANKETLVAAGAVMVPAAERAGATLLPVDSEHSAIWQCRHAGRTNDEIRRLVVTASGGPFRTWSAERLRSARVEDALNHPTWSMGRKVTVDSASMMNKALEVVEAHWLFGLDADRIDAIVHPQSIVHSFVEFVDGSVLAQLSPPDMRTPIQYALTYPARVEGCSRRLDWSELRTLAFEPVDHARFPAVRLASRVVREGGSAGATLNAANEVAVESFLRGQISFPRIAELVEEALDAIPRRAVRTLSDALAADRDAREWTRDRIAAPAAAGIPAGPRA